MAIFRGSGLIRLRVGEGILASYFAALRFYLFYQYRYKRMRGVEAMASASTSPV
jgi:hypothetical protein